MIVYYQLTMGNLYGVNLLKYDAVIKDIMSGARGELILENMLRTIKDYWNTHELELVRYQQKCKLIKGTFSIKILEILKGKLNLVYTKI